MPSPSAQRPRSRPPSLALIAYLAGSVLLMLALYGPFKTYQDCLAGANTGVARAPKLPSSSFWHCARLGGLDLGR